MSLGRLITVFATALPLLCPYLPCRQCPDACDDRAVITVSANHDDGLHCCEAAECAEDQPEPLPVQCPDGGKLLNCFCGGAVASSMVACPDLDLAGPLHWGVTPENGFGTPAARNLAATDRPPDTGGHFPPLVSGREIRVLASSLLL